MLKHQFTSFISNIFPNDEECLRKLKLAKQKASNTIRFGEHLFYELFIIQWSSILYLNNKIKLNVLFIFIGIGAHLESELIQQLKTHFFSTIIDDTTDVTTSTQIAAIVKYWSSLKQKLTIQKLHAELT